MDEFEQARLEAERRFPYLRNFRDIAIAKALVENKGGRGEFVEPDDPTNPMPGQYTITVGPGSYELPGGIADSIIADMVHAARRDSRFQELKKQLAKNLSPGEIRLAKRRYEQDFKGKYTGTNFSTFENFLNGFWLEGTIQHLLLPNDPTSEIEQFRKANPNAGPILQGIESLFKGIPDKQSMIEQMRNRRLAMLMSPVNQRFMIEAQNPLFKKLFG